jgi:hypothetical protein
MGRDRSTRRTPADKGMKEKERGKSKKKRPVIVIGFKVCDVTS